MQLFIDLLNEIVIIKIMIIQNEILSQIQNDINAIRACVEPDKLQNEIADLDIRVNDEKLWDDPDAARKLLQKKSGL